MQKSRQLLCNFKDIHKLEFIPYIIDNRKGVSAFKLFKADGKYGSQMAIVKYEAGANVPEHLHLGYEFIIVLEGELIDSFGKYKKGDIIVYSPKSSHSLRSNIGCTFIVNWEKPVSKVTS